MVARPSLSWAPWDTQFPSLDLKSIAPRGENASCQSSQADSPKDPECLIWALRTGFSPLTGLPY